ncbi:HlyD family secretion protein [Colwellia sp. MEBiC06753]
MLTAERSSQKLSYYLLAAVVIIWLYSLWADRVTPMTSKGQVHAFLVKISPEVSGKIIEVAIKDDQVVNTGDLLFKIDPRPYLFALEKAQAKLPTTLKNLQYQYSLSAVPNASPSVDGDPTKSKRSVLNRNEFDNALYASTLVHERLQEAKAQLIHIKQQFPRAQQPPELQAIFAELSLAYLELSQTEITAPSYGVVTNAQLSIGQYVTPGSSVITFIDPSKVWIAAMMRENSLEFVKPNQVAKIVLDALPGRTFQGEVISIGWGSSGSNNTDANTGFLSVQPATVDATRYPVNIAFAENEVPKNIRFGSKATVTIFTQQSLIGEWIANVWMWLLSIWKYVS